VVREQELLGQILHRHRFGAPGLYRQQRLILLLGDPRALADDLAGGQEMAQGDAEIRETPETLCIERHLRHLRPPRPPAKSLPRGAEHGP